MNGIYYCPLCDINQVHQPGTICPGCDSEPEAEAELTFEGSNPDNCWDLNDECYCSECGEVRVEKSGDICEYCS